MIPIRGSVPSVRPPVMTVALIAVNVAVFLHQAALPPAALEQFVERYGVVPLRQVWALRHAPDAFHLWLTPIVTSMFLHGGWAHLIGNMLFLWVFGDGVENRLGHARFVAFYFAAGGAASQAQVWFDPAATVPMVGASGAIAGVMGGYMLLYPRAWITLMFPVLFIPVFFEVPVVAFLALWFFEQFFMATASLGAGLRDAGGVAWWAHVGGFVAGAAMVHGLKRRDHLGYRPRSYRDRDYYLTSRY